MTIFEGKFRKIPDFCGFLHDFWQIYELGKNYWESATNDHDLKKNRRS
jgi:hypothetical protein